MRIARALLAVATIAVLLVPTVTLYSSGEGATGGVLRVGIIAVSPLIRVEGWSPVPEGPAWVMANVLRIPHEPLAYQDAKGDWIPLLAESWSISPDGMKYTIKIREHAKWSDGVEVTADDYVFRYELWKKEPLADYWGLAKYIDHIEIVDKRTFVVHLKELFAPFFEYFMDTMPLPRHFWKTVENYTSPEAAKMTETLGPGPFKIVGFAPGTDIIRMVPNEYYWGGKPHLSEIIIRLLKPGTHVPALVEAGELDLAQLEHYAQVAPLVGKPDIMVRAFPGHPIWVWWMAKWAGVLINCHPDKWPYNEVTFRQALAYGLDRPKIMELAAGGYARLSSYGFLPIDFTKWLAPGLPEYPRSVAKAKEMIAALGFKMGPDGFWLKPDETPFVLKLQARPGLETLIATLIAEQWKDIGIKVEVATLASPIYVANYSLGHYDAGVIITSHPLMMDFLMTKFYYEKVVPIGEKVIWYGWTRWPSERFGELISLSRKTTDEHLLRKYYDETQLLYATELPFLGIYYVQEIWAHRTDTLVGWEWLDRGFMYPMREVLLNLRKKVVLPPPVVEVVPAWAYATIAALLVITVVAVGYAAVLRKKAVRAPPALG